jgi:hypothetical protein
MKPVKRLVWSVAISAALCQALYLIAIKGFNEYSVHTKEKLTELFLKKDSFDCLLMGSSSTHYFVNPRIIDSICGLVSYNSGMDGINVIEANMLLDAFLINHPPPRYLVLTLDLSSFNLKRRIAYPEVYLPYLNNPAISKGLEQTGHSHWQYRYFPFLLFTEYDFSLRANALKGFAGETELSDGAFQYKGYKSNSNLAMSEKDTLVNFHSLPIEPEAISCIKNLFHTCHSNHITLILTTAPEYKQNYQRHVTNSAEIFETISRLASENSLFLLREDTLAMCLQKAYFKNTEHVNTAGATVFSRILGNQLKAYLKEH